MQKDLVRRWYEEMWNRWDDAVFDRILDPAIELRGSLGQTHHGFLGIAAYMRFVRNAFPDFHNAVEVVVEEGDRVLALTRRAHPRDCLDGDHSRNGAHDGAGPGLAR